MESETLMEMLTSDDFDHKLGELWSNRLDYIQWDDLSLNKGASGLQRIYCRSHLGERHFVLCEVENEAENRIAGGHKFKRSETVKLKLALMARFTEDTMLRQNASSARYLNGGVSIVVRGAFASIRLLRRNREDHVFNIGRWKGGVKLRKCE